jgi:hypothetical protein
MLCREKVESTQLQEKKHEEDDCQDYLGYIFAACLGSSAHFGARRWHTKAHVLAQSLFGAIELSAVGGWFTLATHRYAQS